MIESANCRELAELLVQQFNGAIFLWSGFHIHRFSTHLKCQATHNSSRSNCNLFVSGKPTGENGDQQGVVEARGLFAFPRRICLSAIVNE